jgi:hypothetical protein
MTTENTETIEQTEVKNPSALLAKNRELLQQLADAKAALQVAQDALGQAQSDKTAMSERLYQLEVLNPLEADLRGVSGGPWKYTHDTAIELGLLKMQADKEGVMRPKWYDETGKVANLENGLYSFLSEVYSRTGNDLGKCLRSSGATGGGATGGGHSGRTEPAAPPPAPAPVMQLGLR